jgi:meso-butanediol dehydrogenase / (S,S)-butanediol dehydrogenase / diacetyl reductase
MTQALAGKIAIVTGAGKGIGRGVSLALAGDGAVVVASGRSLPALEETEALVTGRGGTASTAICDVENPEQIEELVASTVARYGGIDIVINNAQGGKSTGRLLDVKTEAFITAFATGPLATFRMMVACQPYLADRGGVIVNFATGAGIRSDPIGYGCYAAVKEGIRALTRAAAVEWGEHGIRVHTVIPLANSAALQAWAAANPEESAAFYNSVPLRRVGDPEQDIGSIVAFLCSPASGYMTGNTILADGGQGYIQ